MRRFLPVLAAVALVGGIACTDSKDDQQANATAGTVASQATSESAASRSAATSLVQNTRAADDPAAVVKAVQPSVVRIRAAGRQTGAFGSVTRGEGTGTGFIVDDKGHIVTNNHVVTLGTNQAVNQLEIDLWDGRTVQGTLVGRDERTDLAVIKIEADKLTPIKFADPNTVEIADEVLAIGFALDLGSTPTVTKGVVSAKDRVIDETLNANGRPVQINIGGAIQTDAAINPGNSGGPLVNLRGEVVGVNTAGLAGSAGQPVQGIFFAVASGVAQPVVQALIDTGRVDRGYLGVNLRSIDRQIAQAQNLNVNEGAGLDRVEPGTPAEQAGLRTGDVITKIGDQTIRNAGDVSNALARYRSGQKVNVEYVRGQEARTTEITLGDRPANLP